VVTPDGAVWAPRLRKSYVSQVLRLTSLAPEIVEAMLDGRQPADSRLDDLLEGLPLDWARQSDKIGALSAEISV